MNDPRTNQLAHLIVNYSVAVQPGDKVAVRTTLAAMPLALETVRETLRAGGLPHILVHDDQIEALYIVEGNDAQLAHVPVLQQVAADTFDCFISTRGDNNTRTLSGVDPARQRRRAQTAIRPIRDVLRRAADGEMRWVVAMYPTAGNAQEADMSLDDWADFIYGACYINTPDPVAEWQRFAQRQQRLVDWLADKHRVAVKGPHVDLTLSIAGRTWRNSCGRRNMPDGEIFTGPVESSVNGWIRYAYPAIYGGREVEGIELRFEDGRVAEAHAAKNNAFLQEVLQTDEGARYLGEFAIGTNNYIRRFSKSILFDEKIGGTIHLAIGQSYAETGGQNKSMVHWDMICDMRDGGQIWVDDTLFYDSGRFLLLDE